MPSLSKNKSWRVYLVLSSLHTNYHLFNTYSSWQATSKKGKSSFVGQGSAFFSLQQK
jgi:hypothetical protein